MAGYDELQFNVLWGIQEYLAWYTVVIDVSLASDGHNKNFPNAGTGVLIKYVTKTKSRYFILTCKHLIEKKYASDKIRILLRSEETLQSATINDVKFGSLNNVGKSYVQVVQLINRFYSDLVDLVLLEVDPNSDIIKKYRFYEFPNSYLKSPQVDSEVYIMGFSRELYREIDPQGGFESFPFFDIRKVVAKNDDLLRLDDKWHFLIDYEDVEDSVDPKGLSGCGIWIREPSGDAIWTPNSYLIGIQSSYYPKSQLLKVVRIEALNEFILKSME